MAATKAKVLKIAKAEVGYVEKKSNKSLDSKKANEGYNNYTKYNRDMKKIRKAGTLTDFWCCNFLCWLFVMAYGVKKAKELLGGFTNYVPYLYQHFAKKGRVYRSPKAGDIVIFRNCSHVGLVCSVKNGYVYTIEGNTSSGAFNANGGGVWKKKYMKGTSWIKCYCRPKYDKSVSEYPEIKYKDKNKYVGKCKKILIYLGYKGMDKNNGFGKGTLKAVKKFQKKKGLKADGVVGKKTWTALSKAYQKKKAVKKAA